MPGNDPAASPTARRPLPPASRAAAAVAGSVALHAVLLLAVARVAWITAPATPQQRAPAVVWLRDWRPAEPPSAPEAPPSSAQVLRATAPENEAASESPAPSQEPADRGTTSEPAEAQQAARGESEPPRPSENPAPSDEVPGPIDWDEQMRRAAAWVIEQHQRDAGYATFSLKDVPDRAPAQIGPRPPARDIFAESAKSGGGPSLLPYGQSRTKVGRWLSEMCHTLTGGVSVMGFFSLCAQETGRSDLFADAKPEYLKMRPEELTARVRELNDAADARLMRTVRDDAVADADGNAEPSLPSNP
jgi:hypothetical protein